MQLGLAQNESDHGLKFLSGVLRAVPRRVAPVVRALFGVREHRGLLRYQYGLLGGVAAADGAVLGVAETDGNVDLF